MSGILRAIVLSLTILAVLAFSAFGTTAVYADGETPTEEVHTEADPEGCDSDDCAKDDESDSDSEGESGKPGPGTTDDIENTEAEEPAKDAGEGEPAEEATPEPTEEAPTSEEAPAATEEPVKADAPAEGLPEDTTVLDAVPDNTTVTVLNAEGEAQPLATQDSVNAIETSDPIWCPAGQSPTPGANGCTQSFTSFTDLLTFLSGNVSFSGAGTIYVQQGAYLGGEDTIDFNSYDLTNISNADLTITGGWNTTDNTVDATTGSTFNNVNLVIGSSTNPWGGSLTLFNLNFGFDDEPGVFENGITIHSNTNINLANVDVTNAGDDDAGGSGAELHAGNDVNIRDSNFDRNKTSGATIVAGRNVSILNSSFHNSNPAALRQITGLDITSGGAVSLAQVIANGNRQGGADITAGGPVAISNSLFSHTQSMQGDDFFGYGLTVVTTDAIALNTVEANDNFWWGAMLTAGGNIDIFNSVFNANTTEDVEFIDDTGLIITDAANVTIVDSTADENRLIGATINARGDVSITGSSFSNNNGVTVDGYFGYGLQVITLGNIFIDGVTASGNTLFGAHLESGLDTLVRNSSFSNQTSGDAADPTGRGLEIVSGGNVLLENVVIDGNQTFGANIQAGADVFLDALTVTNNGTNGIEVVTSCGNVFLINGTYTGNGQYGLSILNSLLTTSGAPVFGSNGVGDIFNDPGTCVFAPASPLTPPTPPSPPVEEPDTRTPMEEPSTSGNQQGVNSLARAVKHSAAGGVFGVTKFSGGNLSTVGKITLNSLFGVVSNGDLHVGIFTGNYVYIYSASGLEILALAPSPFEQFAINRP